MEIIIRLKILLRNKQILPYILDCSRQLKERVTKKQKSMIWEFVMLRLPLIKRTVMLVVWPAWQSMRKSQMFMSLVVLFNLERQREAF